MRSRNDLPNQLPLAPTSPTTALRSSPRSSPRALVATVLALAGATLPAAAHAQRRPSYIHRGIVTESTHLDLAAAFAYAQDNTIRPAAYEGAAVHTEMFLGVARVLEIGAGFGLRFSQGASNAQADQWARINREWVPQTNRGTDLASNPYFRIRAAIVDHAPARLAFEFYNNFPFAHANFPYGNDTAWSFGFGFPLHLGGGAVRVETGPFLEVDTHWNAGADYFFHVPFRINFEVNRQVWLGIRSGFDWFMETRRNSPADWQHISIPLGFQGGFRVAEPLDIVFDVVFPQFVHTACYGGCNNVFFDVWGFGVGVVVRVF